MPEGTPSAPPGGNCGRVALFKSKPETKFGRVELDGVMNVGNEENRVATADTICVTTPSVIRMDTGSRSAIGFSDSRHYDLATIARRPRTSTSHLAVRPAATRSRS